jgi:hypothetical protein
MTTADHQSHQGKDGYGRRFTTLRSTAVMHITTAITPNPSKDRKEAVGKNTKWNGKLSEPPPTPLRGTFITVEVCTYSTTPLTQAYAKVLTEKRNFVLSKQISEAGVEPILFRMCKFSLSQKLFEAWDEHREKSRPSLCPKISIVARDWEIQQCNRPKLFHA